MLVAPDSDGNAHGLMIVNLLQHGRSWGSRDTPSASI